MKSQELEQAYKLTTRESKVGRSLDEFRDIVHQQLPGAPVASVQFLAVGPFQSYGNRLRRWLTGRTIELKELHVEFAIDGVPFEVREVYAGNGEWKVSYFQSHAG